MYIHYIYIYIYIYIYSVYTLYIVCIYTIYSVYTQYIVYFLHNFLNLTKRAQQCPFLMKLSASKKEDGEETDLHYATAALLGPSHPATHTHVY